MTSKNKDTSNYIDDLVVNEFSTLNLQSESYASLSLPKSSATLNSYHEEIGIQILEDNSAAAVERAAWQQRRKFWLGFVVGFTLLLCATAGLGRSRYGFVRLRQDSFQSVLPVHLRRRAGTSSKSTDTAALPSHHRLLRRTTSSTAAIDEFASIGPFL